MWKEIKLENLSGIDKCVGEFQVWMIGILPYAKMKVKIFESNEGKFTGYTDIQIKRSFDGSFEGAVGFGESVDTALENTIKYFLKMIKSDYPREKYPDGLSEEDILYSDYSDF